MVIKSQVRLFNELDLQVEFRVCSKKTRFSMWLYSGVDGGCMSVVRELFLSTLNVDGSEDNIEHREKN